MTLSFLAVWKYLGALLLLCLVPSSFSSFISVDSNQHLFLKDVDFDSLLLTGEGSKDWNESWFMPLVMLRAPSLNTGFETFFIKIQGKGFIPHTSSAYGLTFLSPQSATVLFRSSFAKAKNTQEIMFTVDVPVAIADVQFQLNLTHFGRPVPYEHLDSLPTDTPLNLVDGTRVPEDGGRKLFVSQTTLYGGLLRFANATCRREGYYSCGKDFAALVSSSEASAYLIAQTTGLSPTFPSKWFNVFQNALVFDPVEKQVVHPFEAGSAPLKTGALTRTGAVVNYFTASDANGFPAPETTCEDLSTSINTYNGAYGNGNYVNRHWMYHAAAPCSHDYSVLCLEIRDGAAESEANLTHLLTTGALPYTYVVA